MKPVPGRIRRIAGTSFFIFHLPKENPINTKIEKVKTHFKKHKTVYLVVTSNIAVAGITVTVMRSNNLQRGLGVTSLQRGLSNTASLVFRSPQTVNMINVIERDGRGHPGYPVRNIESKRIFLSQGDAARTFGVSEGVMSGHLHGKLPDIGGLHFERVNLQP